MVTIGESRFGTAVFGFVRVIFTNEPGYAQARTSQRGKPGFGVPNDGYK